ncbi:DUF92 domain-containing protein [Pedobacter hiemivivus]|uniref:DUF92 domain-containing protein n=1 Tax=Pedobacter hiemivivus TaxID=2530454 RepID=A0A4R0N7G0_9SPHI|nr:DUF92 domain-containing protein [Pedobacter hiemivivus]TCC96039.1 DUF92 domain-containing protein [Pedobacter hiemivivus]
MAIYTSYLPYLFLSLAIVMLISVKAKKLTIPAALSATGIGLLVLQAAQVKGVLMLLTFFLLSVWATAHKKAIKAKLHVDNLANMGRTAGQVFANGGVAGLTAILAIIDPSHIETYLIMMAASLASALADTLSSELGMVYGRRFYNIITLKKEANGLDGVVSLEGLLIGTVGACIIALIYAGLDKMALIVVFAGTLGNLTDSILGATLERKHQIGNNTVNFLNTLFAALVAMVIYNNR